MHRNPKKGFEDMTKKGRESRIWPKKGNSKIDGQKHHRRNKKKRPKDAQEPKTKVEDMAINPTLNL
jgi:hypothetical protein